jgi:hypothetical protein
VSDVMDAIINATKAQQSHNSASSIHQNSLKITLKTM